jgi:predicted SnoaL-like aldol condensation-catalyzing enzyme
MSETNKDVAVAFYKTVTEGRVEDAFRLYAAPTYRQHNPLIEDGMEGLRKVASWLRDARYEIKRVFADGDHVIVHSHWHGLSDNPHGEAVVASNVVAVRCNRAARLPGRHGRAAAI